MSSRDTAYDVLCKCAAGAANEAEKKRISRLLVFISSSENISDDEIEFHVKRLIARNMQEELLVSVLESFMDRGKSYQETEQIAQRAAQLAVEFACTKRQRTEHEGATAKTVQMSVANVNEVALWDEHVATKVPCTVVTVAHLLNDTSLVQTSLRWLALLLLEAPTLPISEITGVATHEVSWHKSLLKIYQAAARGQPGVQFAKEDKSTSDKSREDIRCLISGQPKVPQEAKAKYALALGGDNGIQKNKAAFAKLLKCVVTKYNDRLQHLMTFASRIEAVWVCKFQFGQQPQDVLKEASVQQQQQHHQASYSNLQHVEVAPAFPSSKGVMADGVICHNISKALHKLRAVSGATLADLLIKAAVFSPTCPPPGFHILNQYVNTLCHMFDIPIVAPCAVYSIPSDKTLNLSNAALVHVGCKSIVLRVEKEDSVFKVTSRSVVEREVAIHRVVDPLHCSTLRSMVGYGQVTGAGEGLDFVELQGFYSSFDPSQLQDVDVCKELLQQAVDVVACLHRAGVLHCDIKPSNFLQNGKQLMLNDFDVSCLLNDEVRRTALPVGTKAFWSPRMDDQTERYEQIDDWLGLGLTCAFWLRVYNPESLEVLEPQSHATVKRAAVQTLLLLPYVPRDLVHNLSSYVVRHCNAALSDLDCALTEAGYSTTQQVGQQV